MSAADVAKLVDTLRERGVIRADAPAMPVTDDDRPWFVAILQGIAGWLAGVFLLVFIAMVLKTDSVLGIAVCGVLLLAGAWALYFAARDIVFLEQLALALSIAGQFALLWSIVKDHGSGVFISAMILALQLGVFAVMPNKLARTIATFFACCAWIYLVRFTLQNGRADHFFLDDDGIFSPPRFGSLTALAAWFCSWAPIVFGMWALLRAEPRWMASGARAFARPALAGLLLACALVAFASEPAVALGFDWDVPGVGRSMGWYVLFPLLSIGLAMFAAWYALRLRSYGLLGLAIVAALGYLGRFYYKYGVTLLAKSVLMFAIGAVLLAIAWLLARRPGATA